MGAVYRVLALLAFTLTALAGRGWLWHGDGRAMLGMLGLGLAGWLLSTKRS